MHKPESIMRNSHKIFKGFEIKMHLQVLANRPDFATPANYRVRIKQSKNLKKYLDLAGELKIFDGVSSTNHSWNT